MWQQSLKAARQGLKTAVVLSSMLSLMGCRAARAPDFLVFGSYFPNWLVGTVVTLPLTLLVRWMVIRIGLEEAMPALLFVYTALFVLLTMGFAYIFSPR